VKLPAFILDFAVAFGHEFHFWSELLVGFSSVSLCAALIKKKHFAAHQIILYHVFLSRLNLFAWGSCSVQKTFCYPSKQLLFLVDGCCVCAFDWVWIIACEVGIILKLSDQKT
jgi:hypothetical protein